MKSSRLLDQPRSVWAVAFASVVAFMGIGLVDPILPTLAHDLNATPSQVSLLFTSYFAMTGLSMLVSGWVSSRIGARRTLLFGLALVVAFSALAGASGSVFEIAGFRLGWGLGNALFIATALSVIVGAASGGLAAAIMLYEAALGLGIASGPLLGGLLGGISWRGPFFGTAVLMAVGFVLITVLLERTPQRARPVGFTEPLRALAHPGLRSMAIVAVLYNFGFFTILAYTPFPLGLGIHQLGFVFFGWGLLVAFSSVFVAQRLERRFGLLRLLGVAIALVAVDLLLGGLLIDSQAALIVLVIASGALLGTVNTVLTEAVMAASPVERPIASSAYSFVRFTGGAVAPWLAGKLAEHISASTPMYFGAVLVTLGVVALAASRRHLTLPDEKVEAVAPAAPAPGSVLVAIDSSPGRDDVVRTAARVAKSRGTAVHVVHLRETRVIETGPADLEDRETARAVLDEALATLERSGVASASGTVLNVTGHHEDAASAVLEAAASLRPVAIVVGRPSPHGREPGSRSLVTSLSERAPCDVLVVAAREAAALRAAA